MAKIIKIETEFTSLELRNYLHQTQTQFASIGMSLKEAEFSMLGEVLIEIAQKIDEAESLMKEFS